MMSQLLVIDPSVMASGVQSVVACRVPQPRTGHITYKSTYNWGNLHKAGYAYNAKYTAILE